MHPFPKIDVLAGVLFELPHQDFGTGIVHRLKLLERAQSVSTRNRPPDISMPVFIADGEYGRPQAGRRFHYESISKGNRAS